MELVLEILKNLHPTYDFLSSDDFIKDGILDSFDIITLVAELEKKLDICINGEDVTPENFNNIENLSAFVKKYTENENS